MFSIYYHLKRYLLEPVVDADLGLITAKQLHENEEIIPYRVRQCF